MPPQFAQCACLCARARAWVRWRSLGTVPFEEAYNHAYFSSDVPLTVHVGTAGCCKGLLQTSAVNECCRPSLDRVPSGAFALHNYSDHEGGAGLRYCCSSTAGIHRPRAKW